MSKTGNTARLKNLEGQRKKLKISNGEDTIERIQWRGINPILLDYTERYQLLILTHTLFNRYRSEYTQMFVYVYT